MANQIDEEIIDVENAPQGGSVEVGARDPVTGQRFERFNPTINSTNLAPTAQADFNTPEELPVFPVDKIDLSAPTLEPTGTETQASDFSTQIQGLNEQLLGQSAFQSEQDQQAGVSEAQQTQTDLTSQLKAIQNEALAIPLQVQQESIGRGRTAGGVAPLQTARLRNNAIQALAVNSLLEASRGNLATAQAQADRAVAQKFDPIKEEIAVKTANLNLILQSPEYSRQQKNRAQSQLDAQQAKLRVAEQQEAEASAISKVAIQAAKFGVDAVTLNNIQNAQSETDATQLAQQAGVFASTGEQFTLSPGQARFDEQTGELIASLPKEMSEIDKLNIENKKLDILNKIQDLNSTDLDSKTITQVDKLSSSFDSSPTVKQFNEVQNKKLSIDAIVENGVGGPADLALVFEFMKALDPTSVVRESEYAAASASGNIFLGWATKFNGYMKEEGGFLPKAVKNEFKRITGDKFGIIQKQYTNLRDEKARLINQKTGGNDGSEYLIDYDFNTSVAEQLPPLNQTYSSLDNLVQDNPAYLGVIEKIDSENPEYTDEEILQIIQQDFSQDLSKSENGSIEIGSRLGKVNNNPGNLRFIGQAGASQGEGGFAKFESPQAGYQALVNDLTAKQSGKSRTGLTGNSTLKELMNVYAPPVENDTGAYVNELAKRLGISINKKIKDIDIMKLAMEIASIESLTKLG